MLKRYVFSRFFRGDIQVSTSFVEATLWEKRQRIKARAGEEKNDPMTTTSKC
jgi:hypothetical protein